MSEESVRESKRFCIKANWERAVLLILYINFFLAHWKQNSFFPHLIRANQNRFHHFISVTLIRLNDNCTQCNGSAESDGVELQLLPAILRKSKWIIIIHTHAGPQVLYLMLYGLWYAAKSHVCGVHMNRRCNIHPSFIIDCRVQIHWEPHSLPITVCVRVCRSSRTYVLNRVLSNKRPYFPSMCAVSSNV